MSLSTNLCVCTAEDIGTLAVQVRIDRTATRDDPIAFWSAGPLLISQTSPTPMIPHLRHGPTASGVGAIAVSTGSLAQQAALGAAAAPAHLQRLRHGASTPTLGAP